MPVACGRYYLLWIRSQRLQGIGKLAPSLAGFFCLQGNYYKIMTAFIKITE